MHPLAYVEISRGKAEFLENAGRPQAAGDARSAAVERRAIVAERDRSCTMSSAVREVAVPVASDPE
jgi:hypothetical protein